jgi:hypothetical protein
MDDLRLFKAIARKCRDCCNGQRREVLLCPSKDCPLWPYRAGDERNSDAQKGDEPTGDEQANDEQIGDQREKTVLADDSPSQRTLFD